MERVTLRELRHRGGEVVRRAAAGNVIIVTDNGRPLAEIRPLSGPRRRRTTQELKSAWGHLRPLDAERLREDVDSIVDQSL